MCIFFCIFAAAKVIEMNMDNKGEIVIYQTQDGTTQLDVRLDGETVWITQDQMAQLFLRDRTAIGRHINNIYAEGELERESTCAKFAYVPETSERSYEIAYYNLDVIISVGYRAKSQRGVQFWQWATKVANKVLCLPMHHALSEEDMKRIIDCIQN